MRAYEACPHPCQQRTSICPHLACSTADLVQLIQDLLGAPDLHQAPANEGFPARLIMLHTKPWQP